MCWSLWLTSWLHLGLHVLFPTSSSILHVHLVLTVHVNISLPLFFFNASYLYLYVQYMYLPLVHCIAFHQIYFHFHIQYIGNKGGAFLNTVYRLKLIDLLYVYIWSVESFKLEKVLWRCTCIIILNTVLNTNKSFGKTLFIVFTPWDPGERETPHMEGGREGEGRKEERERKEGREQERLREREGEREGKERKGKVIHWKRKHERWGMR